MSTAPHASEGDLAAGGGRTASADGDASVAIVGIGCRFPGGVDGPGSFWRLLRDGVDAVGEIPPDRMDIEALHDPRPATPGRIMTRRGGFLGRLDTFDAAFFGIAPREAERMDPQQRLLLETAWESLEDAGANVEQLAGQSVGVFVGQWLSDFEARLFADPDAADFYMTTGSGRYASSGRLSFAFGFTGPSLTVDTACSSSLAAVHLACQSVRHGESTLALAAGVNVILQPHISIAYSQSRMMAPDGRCKFGDARGDGYVRSEGCGVVVLKPLHQALAAGDRVYAVIRGSAVNNDGRSSGSLGTPSREGQRALLRRAYAQAGVAPSRVRYVEAHGTGTRTGDPVELDALGAVLSEGRAASARCLVGSVKTNVGHTEGAAGIAGLIKCALALHHDAVPPSLHHEQPNPAIPWAALPFDVPRTLSPWPSGDGTRVAGVSAFGIAGSNAHVVLEEAPSGADSIREDNHRDGARAHALVLSARAPEALAALADAHAAMLASADAPALADVCASAARLRTPLAHRAVFVAEDAASLVERLQRFGAGESEGAQAVGDAPTPTRRRVAFVFPGQGAQWIGMARELSAREPAFRDALAACQTAMRSYVDWSLHEQLHADTGSPQFRMDDIAVIQPVLLAVEIALAALWRAWGVEPEVVVGHSMGEVGAAYVAGALTLDEAMRVICRRSDLLHRTSGHGAMALVELTADETAARIAPWAGRLSVAVSNAPKSTVVSGDPEAVLALLAALEAEGVFCRRVKVDVASHSPQMDALVPELVADLAPLAPRATTIGLLSTVTGTRIDGTGVDAAYWGRNLRERVRFAQTVEALAADGIDCVIELSPHPVLLPSIQQGYAAAGRRVLALGSLRRGEPEQAAMLAGVGALWVAGHPVDWTRVAPAAWRRVTLPGYPWQRQRHWHSAADRLAAAGGQQAAGARHPVLGTAVDLADSSVRAWRLALDARRLPWTGAHTVHGATLLPASAVLELMLAAATATLGSEAVELADVRFEHPTHLVDDRAELQTQVTTRAGHVELSVWVRADESWRRHARASARPLTIAAPKRRLVPPGANDRSDSAAFYSTLAASGVQYADALRAVTAFSHGPHASVAALTVVADAPKWPIAPELLDACLQLAVAGSPSMRRSGALAMPRAIASVRIWASGPGPLVAVATHHQGASGGTIADVVAAAGEHAVSELKGIALHQIGGEAGVPTDPARWLYALTWQAASSFGDAAVAGPWLIVGDTGRATDALAEALGAGSVVVTGDAAVAAMLPRTASDGTAWSGIVVCVPLDSRGDTEIASALSAGSPGVNVREALAVLRALDGGDWPGRPRLWLVTRGAQAVVQTDAVDLAIEQAPLWGLSRALEVEHGDLFGAAIDLDPARDAFLQTSALSALLAHAAARTAPTERWLALRNDQAMVARLKRVSAPSGASEWRTDGTWLVTGGLGGVGAHIAHWLVSRGARRLLLLGRTALPSREQWSGLDPGSDAASRLRTILDLEAAGAEVHYRAVDVGDEAALSETLHAWRRESRQPVRGVVHAAGATGDQLLAHLDATTLARVNGAKVAGAWALHRALPEAETMVFFSSIATVMATPGQGAYAAANAFLDALARRRAAGGRRAVSVSWGVWAETGFAAGEGGRRAAAQLAEHGILSFSPEDGVIALGEVLRGELAHSVVVPADWSRLNGIPLFAMLAARPVANETSSVGHSASDALADMRAASAERRTELLESVVMRHASSILKLAVARIDPTRPLGSQGLDSLMGLELRNRLERELSLTLSATLIWNYPTVRALAGHLADRIAPLGATAPDVASAFSPVLASAASTTAARSSIAVVAAMSDDDALAALRGGGRA